MISAESKKILPLFFPPPVSTYLHYIVPAAIALAYENAWDLFYTNYVQVSIDFKRFNSIRIFPKIDCYRDSLVLENTRITNNVLPDFHDLLAYIQYWLNHDFYVECKLAEKQLLGTHAFTREPILHPVLLYGYDAEQRLFYSVNFKANGNLVKMEFPFDIIKNAFFSEETLQLTKEFYQDKPEHNDIHAEIWLHRVYKNFQAGFNKEIFLNLLRDYLNSANTSLTHHSVFPVEEHAAWGLSVYREVSRYLTSNDNPVLDYRIFHCIWELKKLWEARLLYFEKKNIIRSAGEYITAFQSITKDAKALKLHSYEYLFQDQKQVLIPKMVQLLEKIYEAEKNILNKLLVDLV